MYKGKILSKSIDTLKNGNWDIFRYNGCFDIVAKKSKMFLVKVLYNIDSIQKKTAKNLKIIAKDIGAIPVIVGTRTKEEKLERGVVYERFGIPSISPNTFSDIIENERYPTKYRDRGGFYVEIDRDKLRELRKKRDITQKRLAELVGVTKKMIYEHESRDLRMLFKLASEIENILEEKIIKDIDIFSFNFNENGYPRNETEEKLKRYFEFIGFNSDFVSQAPFDCILTEKITILSDIETGEKIKMKKLGYFKEFTEFVGKPAMLIAGNADKEEINGIPVIKSKEFKEMNKEDLVEIVGLK